MCYRQGRWKDALDYYHRSLAIMNRIHSNESDHEHFGWLSFRLAQCSIELRNFSQAKLVKFCIGNMKLLTFWLRGYLQTALRIRQLGTLHQREKARVLYAFHEVARELGNGNQAEAYLKDATRVRASIIGEDGRAPEILTRLDFDKLQDPLE